MNDIIWKDIIGYEGLYKINNIGEIISISKNIYISQRIHKGYLTIKLSKNSIKKNYTVHQLVAIHFIKNIDNKIHINYIDGNKLNNNVNNLEWCTIDENNIHAMENKLNKSSLSKDDVNNIKELLKTIKNQSEIARMYNVSPACISRINSNKRRSKL